MLEQLAACETPSCRPQHLRALANAGLPDTIPILLQHAEGPEAGTSEAAIKALRRMGQENISRPVPMITSLLYQQVNAPFLVYL